MKTEKQIRALIRAALEGREAGEQGKNLDANPYPEDDERHWRWFNAWCVARSGKSNDQVVATALRTPPSK